MKIKKMFFVFCLIIIACINISVYADVPNQIIIGGSAADIPEEMGSIKLFSDRTFVPVRFVLEYFEYTVTWDEEDKIVFGRNLSGDIFVMQSESPYLTVRQSGKKSETVVMDVSPVLVAEEGRIYIPIRFLAQAIGYNVGYDEAAGTVKLDK